MSNPAYIPRVVDDELSRRMQALGGILIEGPKACGKTLTARQLAASEVRLDIDRGAREAAAIDPALILEGTPPRLIDEWQVEPAIWGHVRHAIDDRRRPGQFILTGSATPADDATRHSGAGRIGRLKMRPLSLAESGLSSADVSLRLILNGDATSSSASDLSIENLAVTISRGGWPGLIDLDTTPALEALRDYITQVCRTDISTVDGVKRDPEKVGRVMSSLARNVATTVELSTLAADAGRDKAPLYRETVAEYLSSLERIFVVEEQPAWSTHLRSTYTLRKAAKRHFVDPSLAVAALRTGPEALVRDLRFLGCLFESLVVRDLRVYSQACGGDVYHYRDSNNLEVDAIVSLRDGPWAAFEIKLGTGRIDEAAASLKRFRNQIDTSRVGEPAAMAVVVANGYGYVRKDGIHVIPIGALGP